MGEITGWENSRRLAVPPRSAIGCAPSRNPAIPYAAIPKLPQPSTDSPVPKLDNTPTIGHNSASSETGLASSGLRIFSPTEERVKARQRAGVAAVSQGAELYAADGHSIYTGGG